MSSAVGMELRLKKRAVAHTVAGKLVEAEDHPLPEDQMIAAV